MLGGDPATIAKQAKAIAQEIKAAASEYSSALKSEGADGATAAAATAAIDSTSPETDTPAGAIGADAVAAGPATTAAAAVVVTATPPDQSGSGASAASVNPAATSAPQALAKPTDPEAARQKTIKAYQDAANGAAAKASHDRGEQDVLAKFKDAALEVKQIIEDAARKLRAKHRSDPDASAAVQAGVAVDQAVQELSDAMQAEPSSGGVDISISLGIVAAAVPTLDIRT